MGAAKLIAGLTALGALGVAGSAAAEQRTITVTLLGGKVIELTVDVPAGTPLDQVRLPPVSADGGPSPAAFTAVTR